MYSVSVRHPCMAINDIVQYTINSALPPAFYCLPKPLSLYALMVLLLTLVPSSYLCIAVVMLGYDWWLCLVINISVEYNGGLLPDIILLTHGYYHWGTRLITM